MHIKGWLYLSSSPWEILLHCDLLWKRRDPKNIIFIGANNWIALAVRWTIKYFSAPNLSMFWIRLAEKRQEVEAEHMQMQRVMRFMQKQ